MIKKIQQDFSYYSHEFKDNYRKGVHRLRTILASRAQAQAFVSNAGGTAVVLGYEPETPDKNAQELYALLAASPYIDDAVQTFLGSIYEAGAESQDAMYSDSARCLEILHDPVMSRAAGAGTVSAGKWIATLAGQSCNLYRDMNAVAASDIAMTAVAASETAMEAVISGTIALNAVAASKTAMTAVAANETAMAAVAASRVAMSAIIGNSTALNAVVTSSVAMAAIIGNSTALNAVVSSSTAMAAVAASQTAMAAIASSQTAMAAIASSQTAMAAIASSQTAMAAIASSSTAMAAIIGNSTALNAVVSSSTAMAAVASSNTARTAITNSATAKNALASSPLKTTVTKGNGNGWENRTIRNGMGYLISCYNANSGGEAGSTWYKLDGAQTSQPAGTTNVGKFFTSSLAIYWWSSTSSVTYIPC
ncbi:hypothetical protein BUFA31_14950 [Butyricicoccus faecihominis]|uniref:Tail fiber protein n=1 Tax=Butyricicoccus faecihominis TaxID=1712515 RepID=A0ABQ1E060_9FIRM|nr:hypothetical protein [Butyricicoccus faecihominis]GFO88331.1 hypothetical protein BUFA31_14950 [Butyricicoccus faecihominis]GGM65669.1 hypothetical protein GCM10007040_06190 [Butyricicoccus faecihominis]